jgi:hypothetical protein
MVTAFLQTHDRVSVYRVVAEVLPDTDVMVIQAEQQADQLDHEPEQLVQLAEALGEKVIEEAKDRRRVLLQEAEELDKTGQLSAAQERRMDAEWFHHLITRLEEGKMEEINSYIIHIEDILTDESISGCDKSL